MSESSKKSRSSWSLRTLFRGELPLETETTRYILVSALDVFMTWYLLSQGDVFYESNPIARFFLYGWGMRGMIYFKFAMVTFVCVITQIIAIKKLELARKVLNFATLLVAGVVVYSLSLYLRFANVL